MIAFSSGPVVAALYGAFLGLSQTPLDSASTAVGPASMISRQEGFTETPEELQERLAWLSENPLDLNRISAEELQTLPGVLAGDALALVALRKRLGELASLRDILRLDGGDALLERILPYVVLRPRKERRTGHFFHLRTLLQFRPGVGQWAYDGPPTRHMTRISIAPADGWEGCLIAERDPGERTADASFHGFARLDEGRIGVLIGDYRYASGFGLVVSSRQLSPKGSDPIAHGLPMQTAVVPHRSTSEYGFFRGVAVSLARSDPGGSLFAALTFSSRDVEASASQHIPSSLEEYGLFRTESERRRRGRVRKTDVGGTVGYQMGEQGQFGLTAISTVLSNPLALENDVLGPRRRFLTAGFNGHLTTERGGVAGEIAVSDNGGMAAFASASLRWAAVRCAVSYRHYSPHFVSLNGSAMSEYGRLHDERGCMGVLEVRLEKRLVLSGYIDLFTSLRYDPDLKRKSMGSERGLSCEVKPAEGMVLVVRLSSQVKPGALAASDLQGRVSYLTRELSTRRLRCAAEFRPLPWCAVATRVDVAGVRGDGAPQDGTLAVLEGGVEYEGCWSSRIQFCLFRTDSWDSRIVVREPDLPGAFTTRQHSGTGNSAAATVRWTPLQGCTIALKVGEVRSAGDWSGLTVERTAGLQLDVAW